MNLYAGLFTCLWVAFVLAGMAAIASAVHTERRKAGR